MTNAKRDDNYVPTMLAVSNADSTTPVRLEADPTTKRLLVDVTGGSGTSSTDDAAFTAGTDSGTPIMGFASSDTVDAGDVGVLAMDTSRRLLVSLEVDNVGIGGGTQYTEDAAHTTGDTGTLALVVRQDTPGNLSGTDGDYEALQVSGGRLWASTLVTGDALTALQLIDDPVFADDAAFTTGSSKVMMAGAIRDDSLTTLTAVEGDAVPLRVSSTGALHVTGAGGGTEYNEDAATPATQTGSAIMMERDDALATVTPIEGDWIGLRGTAEGALWVQDFNSDALLTATQAVQTAVEGTLTVGSHAVTNAGTFAVQVDAALPAGTNAIGKLAANSGVDIGDVDVLSLPASTNTLEVVGDVAHDAAVAGNPVLVGSRATNSVEGATQVANGDATYTAADLNGVTITRPHTTLEEIISERVADTGGTSTALTNFAAGGAGVHNYITSIVVYNSSATDGYVDIRDGSAGSVLMTVPAPQTGGATINLPVPLKGSANTALAYDVSGAISTVYITVVGFQAQG